MIAVALPEGRASGNHRQKSCHHIVIHKGANGFHNGVLNEMLQEKSSAQSSGIQRVRRTLAPLNHMFLP